MYTAIFSATTLVAAIIYYFTQYRDSTPTEITITDQDKDVAVKTPEFIQFQRTWLAVYLLAMFSDWLQGPYAYALYDSLGFNSTQIAYLSVTGFGSSMLVGTFVGGLSDSLGRKRMTFIFALLYSLSCITKLSTDFTILLLGRVLSGVATSLLFCVFEAWMVCEHNKKKFHPSLISDTFSKATAGNGFCAVFAGLVATQLANTWGNAAPFVFAILPLIALSIIISLYWEENTGHDKPSGGDNNNAVDTAVSKDASGDDKKDKQQQQQQQQKEENNNEPTFLQKLFSIFQTQPHIFALGLAQSLFEGAMFTFVFLWSPTLANVSTYTKVQLEGGGPRVLPFGTIFANFMVAISCGSYIFGWVAKTYSPDISPLIIHGLACISMVLSAMFSETNEYLVLFFFLIFEMTCGMFWPTYGTLRSIHIPEAQRATISTVFRIPLNLFVIVLLLQSASLTRATMFIICGVAHFVSLLSFSMFYSMNRSYQAAQIAQKETKQA